ncbi:hypothetical protein [Paenibacillus lautus]|uniref:hypothetical protein n=1 Tax=Paenibacillus lautus TaxID=1401 RepID=UPI001C7D14CB|nr:hypothetical protein [Paenibacillus lautus]MBX4152385.1 hypothetical protein [Paenibacillus lautus]
MKKYLFIFMIFVLAVLTACGKNTQDHAKPDAIRDELWDKSKQLSIIIINAVNTRDKHDDYVPSVSGQYKRYSKELPNITEKEQELVDDVSNLFDTSINEFISRSFDEHSKEYAETKKKIEDWFGVSDLAYENYNSTVLSAYFDQAKQNEIDSDPVKIFMDNNNITLTAKDVQFNMSNNLDKDFAISGTAKLDDYYNYGFDTSIESEYFNLELTPEDGDRWSLYLEREAFTNLFEELQDKGEVQVTVSATIPSGRFEPNQGNMAFVTKATW